MGLFFTCKETAATLSDYQDGILPLAPFLKTRAHLFNCPGCRTLLATLRVLPALAATALAPEDDGWSQARRAMDAALEGALARLALAAAEVPEEARRVLAAGPDLPMRLLASTHEHLARWRTGPPQAWPLPQDILDQLPPPERWNWQEGPGGSMKAELCAESRGGLRLLLVYAAPDSTLPPHRHLGSESILVLDGAMDDLGRQYCRGDWVHYAHGTCHSPRIAPSGCWCLIREQGKARLMDAAAWLRHLSHAS